MMSDLFAATRRTDLLVGREPEMETIRQAIMAEGDDCRIVFIHGDGGYGKTRLLQETLLRLGNTSSWENSESQEIPIWRDYDRRVATDIIDLIDTRLHARNNFLRAVRQSLNWAGEFSRDFNFTNYDTAVAEFERRLLDNVEYRLMREAAQKARAAFWKDYEIISKTRRIVWAIDTAEQLTNLTSRWLIEKKLLSPGQLRHQTQQWLASAIRNEWFRNTTLLLAGRDKEGKAFFEGIASEAIKAHVEYDTISARPFTEEEIRKYFSVQAQAWRSRSEAPQDQAGQIADVMHNLAEDEAQGKLFYSSTGGQPVRLALFSDLLLESRTFPEPLRPRSSTPLDPELAEWRLEEGVIDLLFAMPRRKSGQSEPAERWRSDTLRRDILLALVRARMGLDAEQLHYLIDNVRSLPPEAWAMEASQDRIRQIEAEMHEMRWLSIIKGRPFANFHVDDGYGNGHGPTRRLRLGLQDEIYRIFADHQAPHVHPGNHLMEDAHDAKAHARLERIWQQLEEGERQRYERSHRDEQAERADLYLALREWAYFERKKRQKKLTALIEKEEQAIERELYRVTPAAPRAARLQLSEEEVTDRKNLRREIREFDLEYMHYAFLLRPEYELNDAYFDLADVRWWANDEDADINTQGEMVRIMYDIYAIRFIKWEERIELKDRGEEAVDVLRRAAQQEDASRWLKRLSLRREYNEAVEFAHKLEATIAAMPVGHDKTSWLHTFVTGERACWLQFARILPGQGSEIRDAISELKEISNGLLKLATTPANEIAIPEKGEKGFIGHPALTRVRRVLSVVYANIAYAHTQMGDFRTAVGYYAKALDFIRETGAQAHRATVINNLSRALSEMGRFRGLRLCLDALEMRQKLGADVPIGLSHSTLALIYNDQNNPDRGWVEAAKAILFFQRVNDPRGLGLALIQLGEALRRMAGQDVYGRALPVTAEELFRAAEDALNEAMGIFSNTDLTEEERDAGKVDEPLRWIEVRIEKGSLQRDRVRVFRSGDARGNWRNYYSQALALLREAAHEARAKDWKRLELDAVVNIAWAHYYAGELEDAEIALAEAEMLIPPEANIHLSSIPDPERVESHYLYQQSKMYGLRGRMALDAFLAWVQGVESEINQAHPREDVKRLRTEVHKIVRQKLAEAPHHLDQAAEFMITAVFHAQLFSPRSAALSAIYNTLYSYLKKFNAVELEAFQRQVNQSPIGQIHLKSLLEDLGDLPEFLRESIGEVSLPVDVPS